MSTAIAILTFNRVQALHTVMLGLTRFCKSSRTAVFEDCGQLDTTEEYLTKGRQLTKTPLSEEILADYYTGPDGIEVFMGKRNVGVAGNSNRCIRWFNSLGPEYTHLCILNDDLHIQGDFASFYQKAHADLGVGLFCFCDFTSETYRWVTQMYRGYAVKVLPRMTGIMMSMTKGCLDKIGYFDARYGKFGEEHCDFTVRARIAGFVSVGEMAQNCLDVDHKLLRHQDVPTSMQGAVRASADAEAANIMREIAQQYPYAKVYRPFAIDLPKLGGGRDGAGIPVKFLEHYALISGR